MATIDIRGRLGCLVKRKKWLIGKISKFTLTAFPLFEVTCVIFFLIILE